MQIQYAPCEMILTWTGGAKSTEDLVKEAQKLNLRKRRLDLQAEIAELKDALGSKTTELADVNSQLNKSESPWSIGPRSTVQGPCPDHMQFWLKHGKKNVCRACCTAMCCRFHRKKD